MKEIVKPVFELSEIEDVQIGPEEPDTRWSGNFNLKNYLKGEVNLFFKYDTSFNLKTMSEIENDKNNMIFDSSSDGGLNSIIYGYEKDGSMNIKLIFSYKTTITSGLIEDEIIKECLVDLIKKHLPKNYLIDVKYMSNLDEFLDSTPLTIKI